LGDGVSGSVDAQSARRAAELTTKGQKIAWSIADYLASLEKGVGELLKEKDKPEAKAAPKAEPKIASKIDAKAPSKPEEPKPGTAYP
jgi:F-type H+-transporting ATPase subunit b